MLFLQPLYEYIFHHYAAHINHFALIKLILYSLDKTLFYFIIFVCFVLHLMCAVPSEARRGHPKLVYGYLVFI